jgi:hypothetical protein
MKRGIFFSLLAVALLIAFIFSLAPGSIRSDVQGTEIILPQKNNTVNKAVESTTTSTTRLPPLEIGLESACRVNADCGITYLASCHCDGDDLSATQYIPLCLDGSCVWKSKTGVLFCRGRDYESGDNSTGQRCVNGFGRCIKNREVERYLVLRPNITVVNDTNIAGYSKEYQGYRFRYNRSEFYSPSSLCYENQYYVFDYIDEYDQTGQISISWTRSAILRNAVIKIGSISQDENGSINPILWIRRARKNDTGLF